MNRKVFHLNITQATPYDTDMLLCPFEGGKHIRVSCTLELQSFSGTSSTASESISVMLTSDSDASGSPVLDEGDVNSWLCGFTIPDGWPRPVPGIDGAPKFQSLMDMSFDVLEFDIPARGRNLYLRLGEPATLPDPSAVYSIRCEVTILELDGQE